MPEAGIEPARLLRTQDFESSASTIPPLGPVPGAKVRNFSDNQRKISILAIRIMEQSLTDILKSFSSVLVVCDRNVENYAREIAAGLDPEPECLPIDAGEPSKNMDTVLDICRWLLARNADRKSIVLAVGGGTTSDMVGFAASIYKRGIAYANIPTTLLAMVDASIGGKTGVNLDGYKNMIGVFRQPEFTYVFPEALQTLPEREFRSGSAELLKTFIIGDKRKYREAVKVLSGNPTIAGMAPLIQAAAAIKEEIVNEDPFEQGRRRVLNLGHTWAHAIEWWQKEYDAKEQYTHGEAVAIGIIQAARRSEAEGLAEKGLADKLAEDFIACGLPTELPCPEEELFPAIQKDKKSDGSRVNYVLIEDIGKVI